MTSPAALTWFARHEIRLAWREWMAMMTAGRRFRNRSTAIGLIVFVAIMHLVAYAVIGRFADLQEPLDKPTLIVITACAVPGLGPDAVAGDRIRDPGVLRARRSRFDHVVAGGAGQCVFGAHRGDRAYRHHDGAAALDAVRQRSRARRGAAMVRGLWRRHCDRPHRGGGCDRGDGRAVSHASGRAGPGWWRRSSPP